MLQSAEVAVKTLKMTFDIILNVDTLLAGIKCEIEIYETHWN